MRASLGGVHDEAEIRGHRRTYIGSMPGTIIQSIRKVGTRNPVFMLDEMDKLGVGFHGDPSSALLEVLDPEQNSTFRDHYLDLSFDLSKVFFVGTANVLERSPGRCVIAWRSSSCPATPRKRSCRSRSAISSRGNSWRTACKPEQATIDEAATARELIEGYTREVGRAQPRARDRRGASQRRDENQRRHAERANVDAGRISQRYSARAAFESEVKMRTSVPGVATGLAWTPAGGDILFIEASLVPGKGGLMLTGQLGDVMKESAQAAVSLAKNPHASLRRRSQQLSRPTICTSTCRPGAIPKDGPSAGVDNVFGRCFVAVGQDRATATSQ